MLTLLAWSPVLLLFVLAVILRRSALYLSIAGYIWTALIAVAAFKTSPKTIYKMSLEGLLITLPLLLVVYGGILLASVLTESGSLARLANWLTGATRDEWEKISLLSMGMGNALEGAGIIAEPIAAPMLRASGLSPVASAALSIIGYSGLMTLGLGGVIITVLASVSGYHAEALAGNVAVLSIPASVMMAWSIPLFAGDKRTLLSKLPFLTVMGLVPGVAAWAAVKFLGFQVGELAGGVALTLVIVLPRLNRLRFTRTLIMDIMPLAVMGVGIVAVNTIPGVKEWAKESFAFATLHPFSDAWLYLLLAFILAHFTLLRERSLPEAILKGSIQGWRPLAAMALFGAMGQVMAGTGLHVGPVQLTDSAHNIPSIIAVSLAGTGELFPILVPFLGWVGTFLTGYGVASIMLFTSLLLKMAGNTGMSPILLVSGLAVGASVGGISSPFKVAFAASMCDAAGIEGDVLRKTIPLGITVCLLLGLFMFIL